MLDSAVPHQVPERRDQWPSDQEARDLASLRGLLAGAAAARAAARFDDMVRLQELRALARAAEVDSAEEFVRDEARFEVLLAELSGNRALAAALADVVRQSEPGMQVAAASTVQRAAMMAGRVEVLSAILAGDPDRAEAGAASLVCRSHVPVRPRRPRSGNVVALRSGVSV